MLKKTQSVFDLLRKLNPLREREQLPETIGLHTPVRFDPAVASSLATEYELLSAAVRTAALQAENEPLATGLAVQECMEKLRDLRRCEATWVYPVITRLVTNDATLKVRLAKLRVESNSLAQRLVRAFHELSDAAIQKSGTTQAAGIALGNALAAYRKVTESDLHALYALGASHQDQAHRA